MAAVEVIKTPIGSLNFARAILRAWRALTGALPSRETAGIIWAQYALETGAGGYCWNHNLFNHKCSPSMAAAGVPYMMLAHTWEVEGGHKVVYEPPHPETWFRAYESFAASMEQHLDALKTGRYAAAWAPLDDGDGDAYCARIREHGYYTAPLDSYQRSMRARLAMWAKDPAFDDALAELVAASEAETLPELPESPDTEPQPTVHATLDFPPRTYEPE